MAMCRSDDVAGGQRRSIAFARDRSFGANLGAPTMTPRSAHRSSGRHLEAQSCKSKHSPGPAPKSATTKIEAAGAGTKVIVDQAPADGSTRHWEFTANYDGKDVPVIGNNPDADMMARTRVNTNTVKTISKKNGKVTTTQTSTVSSDGKTRTVTTTGTNAAGQSVNNVAVYT